MIDWLVFSRALLACDRERQEDEQRLVLCLAMIYVSGHAQMVARFCDEAWDPTGELLGRVRIEAANMRALTAGASE